MLNIEINKYVINIDLEILAGLDAAALALVSRVSAVVLSVTFPGQGNAPAIAALELRGLAGDVLTSSLIWKPIN